MCPDKGRQRIVPNKPPLCRSTDFVVVVTGAVAQRDGYQVCHCTGYQKKATPPLRPLRPKRIATGPINQHNSGLGRLQKKSRETKRHGARLRRRLVHPPALEPRLQNPRAKQRLGLPAHVHNHKVGLLAGLEAARDVVQKARVGGAARGGRGGLEIGRASCRERVSQLV